MNKIDWQTGTPLEEGVYIVTLSNGLVTTDVWLTDPCRWYDYASRRRAIIPPRPPFPGTSRSCVS